MHDRYARAAFFIIKEVELIVSQMAERVSIARILLCTGIYPGWFVYTVTMDVLFVFAILLVHNRREQIPKRRISFW